MLDKHEHEALVEIQRGLRAEDPDFTRTFHTAMDNLPQHRHHTTVAIAAIAALGIVMVALGLPGLALLFVAIATGAVMAWGRREAIRRWINQEPD
ncbi:DUF3040 domain-containing protein [Actinophytocola sp.]|uniref:DUF3040 domain-containing protein n=1 Tax=Actinophytocola sp. TaxID=1872138 RepID=UPI0025BD970A|nr:DUF3040 domain-containing protein [Actinophytocola sp.]